MLGITSNSFAQISLSKVKDYEGINVDVTRSLGVTILSHYDSLVIEQGTSTRSLQLIDSNGEQRMRIRRVGLMNYNSDTVIVAASINYIDVVNYSFTLGIYDFHSGKAVAERDGFANFENAKLFVENSTVYFMGTVRSYTYFGSGKSGKQGDSELKINTSRYTNGVALFILNDNFENTVSPRLYTPEEIPEAGWDYLILDSKKERAVLSEGSVVSAAILFRNGKQELLQSFYGSEVTSLVFYGDNYLQEGRDGLKVLDSQFEVIDSSIGFDHGWFNSLGHLDTELFQTRGLREVSLYSENLSSALRLETSIDDYLEVNNYLLDYDYIVDENTHRYYITYRSYEDKGPFPNTEGMNRSILIEARISPYTLDVSKGNLAALKQGVILGEFGEEISGEGYSMTGYFLKKEGANQVSLDSAFPDLSGLSKIFKVINISELHEDSYGNIFRIVHAFTKNAAYGNNICFRVYLKGINCSLPSLEDKVSFENDRLSIDLQGNYVFQWYSRSELGPGVYRYGPIAGAHDPIYEPSSNGWYRVRVSNGNELCFEDSEPIEVKLKSDGVGDNLLVHTKVYPNPCRDLLAVQTNLVFEEISISDLQGRFVHLEVEHRASGYFIETSSFPPGVYILHLGKDAHIRFVKSE